MNEARAAGPKTELVGVSSRMQQSIERQIAALSQGVEDCMENARNAEPRSLADDTRSGERRDAVQMVSSTAELLSSIAKLKGEFHHNYVITRKDEKGARDVEGGIETDPNFVEVHELYDPHEVEALSDDEREDYFRRLKLPPLDLRRRTTPDSTALPPPPENRGSNSDAGKS
jgi:hypothetical protein